MVFLSVKTSLIEAKDSVSLSIEKAQKQETLTLSSKVKIGDEDKGPYLTLRLKQYKNRMTCQTDQVPEHKIEISGLDLSKPYFKGTKNTKYCKQVVTWGKIKNCYDSDRDIDLTTLIRWCSEV